VGRMIVINMPGGAIQEIDEDDLLWFRKAFESEWRGATMLRLASDRLYSIESIADLVNKFASAGALLAEFTAPDARLKINVSSKRVQKVIESNPDIYHENARSVLIFSKTVKLAVREKPEEAREKIKAARASAIS
jgi:hypothetical protein